MTSSASWDALHETITRFAETLDANSSEGVLIKNLLLSLDLFASGLLDFFNQSFEGGPVRLQASAEESTEYIQRLIIDNAAHDLDIIMDAYLQRLPLTKSFSGSGAPGLQEHLRKTDALARAALEPAYRCQLPTNFQTAIASTPYALTYYNQSTQIRLIPYYPLVLIGVPFSSIGRTLDLCAIPHELGHVIYRTSENMTDSAGKKIITDRVQKTRSPKGERYAVLPSGPEVRSNWYDPWLEEMFADVYGCMVAGPYITRHFMNLSKGWKGSELVLNPGGYPTPLIRPYVYIKTLGEINQHFPELNLASVIADLTTTWGDFVSLHSGDVQLADGTKMSSNAAAAAIEQAVHDIFAALVPSSNGLSNIDPWPDRAAWSSATSDSIPEIAVAEAAAISVSGDELPEPLDPATARQLIQKMLPNVIAGVIPASEWRKMLSFGGWLDKGPEGGKAH